MTTGRGRGRGKSTKKVALPKPPHGRRERGRRGVPLNIRPLQIQCMIVVCSFNAMILYFILFLYFIFYISDPVDW